MSNRSVTLKLENVISPNHLKKERKNLFLIVNGERNKFHLKISDFSSSLHETRRGGNKQRDCCLLFNLLVRYFILRIRDFIEEEKCTLSFFCIKKERIKSS